MSAKLGRLGLDRAVGRGKFIRSDKSRLTENRTHMIEANEDKTSVLVEIFAQRYGALVGSGSAIRLVNKKVVEKLPSTELMRSAEIKPQSASSNSITV